MFWGLYFCHLFFFLCVLILHLTCSVCFLIIWVLSLDETLSLMDHFCPLAPFIITDITPLSLSSYFVSLISLRSNPLHLLAYHTTYLTYVWPLTFPLSHLPTWPVSFPSFCSSSLQNESGFLWVTLNHHAIYLL